MSNNSNFEIGFWHPFGPHGGKTPEDIIQGKLEDIKKNGWTLWSFQYRKTLDLWFQEIKTHNASNVLVLCSEGKGAKDPKGDGNFNKEFGYYKPINEEQFLKIPSGISITLPSKRERGSAFIVKNIILQPIDLTNEPIEWIEKTGKWRSDRLPTRGEYLIRLGQGTFMRKFRILLELQYPFLAEIQFSE